MAIDRSLRIVVATEVDDEPWQKLIRKLLVATQELGTTVTTTAAGYTDGTGDDNVEIAVAEAA